MKAIKILVLSLLLLGSATANVAHAAHGYYHGPRVGVFVDPWPLVYPWGYPWGYYPYGYYPPQVVVQQQTPTTYVEQGTVSQSAPATQKAPADWYYCRKPEGYYPYVRNCPDGWERVPAQPPAMPPRQ